MGHSYAKGIVGTAEFTLQGQVKTLYTNHHGWLHGWLRYSLNDATGAADLAHDTCVRLIARPRSFTTGPEAPAYLRTVANGLCIDMWRHREIERAWHKTWSPGQRGMHCPPKCMSLDTPGSRPRMGRVFSHGTILI